jgi:hypothetical protein
MGCWCSKLVQVFFFILIPCIIEYIQINQLNALNYILIYFSYTMADTCFGQTMPSSGSDYVPFWANSASIWSICHCCHILCCSFLYIFYTVTVLVYIYCMILLYSDCLLPYWRWSDSERNTVAPWGWHCLAETCRSLRKRKMKKYIIQCI